MIKEKREFKQVKRTGPGSARRGWVYCGHGEWHSPDEVFLIQRHYSLFVGIRPCWKLKRLISHGFTVPICEANTLRALAIRYVSLALEGRD